MPCPFIEAISNAGLYLYELLICILWHKKKIGHLSTVLTIH